MNYRKRSPAEEFSLKVVKTLWPNFREEPSGSAADLYLGVDGFENGHRIQVKYDARIAKTGNLYHELYEKTKGQPQQNWRHATGKVDEYIFTSEGVAFRLPTHVLALLEKGNNLEQINDTSLGFLIPVSAIPESYCFWHQFFLQPK